MIEAMVGGEKLAARTVQILDDHHYYPRIDEVEGFRGGSEVIIDGRVVVNFASNDFLGLSKHPQVLDAAIAAIRAFGCGSGGSRLTAGTHTPHRRLEERIAEFKGTEDAVVFSAGYLVNVGVLPALAGLTLRSVVHHLTEGHEPAPSTVFLLDELVHASILDAMALATARLWRSKATVHFWRHRDTEDLERAFVSSPAENRIVVTDGVFSLHGRLAPLDAICGLCERHGAEVYLDDAHATGVFGANGRGTAEHFGVEHAVTYKVGTFSKALGGSGGFIAGSRDLCRYLRVAARTYMFQAAMPPGVAAGLVAAFDAIRDEPDRRERLVTNAARVRDELVRLGFDILGSESQIIPVKFGTESKAKEAVEILHQDGIFAPPYYFPAVPVDEALVRVNLTSEHTEEQLERLVGSLLRAGRATEVVP